MGFRKKWHEKYEGKVEIMFNRILGIAFLLSAPIYLMLLIFAYFFIFSYVLIRYGLEELKIVAKIAMQVTIVDHFKDIFKMIMYGWNSNRF